MRIRRRVMARRRLLPRRIRHHPLVRFGAMAVVAVVALSVVRHETAAAIAARQRWGEQRTVAVARHRIVVGAVVEAQDITTESWPSGVVPAGAIESSPVGRTATATIEPGEALLAARLAPTGLHGIAALVPPGWRALAIPVGPAVVGLSVGDHVDLIAGFDVSSANGDRAPAFTVARDVVVVAVDEERVTVAVRRTDAEAVAFAIVAGTIVPALTGP